MSTEAELKALTGEAKALGFVASYLTAQVNEVRKGKRSLTEAESSVFARCRRDAQVGVVTTAMPAAFLASLFTKGLRGSRFSLLRWPIILGAGLTGAMQSANQTSERCLVKLLSLPPEESELATEGRSILRDTAPDSKLWQRVLANMEAEGVELDDGLPGGSGDAALSAAATAAIAVRDVPAQSIQSGAHPLPLLKPSDGGGAEEFAAFKHARKNQFEEPAEQGEQWSLEQQPDTFGPPSSDPFFGDNSFWGDSQPENHDANQTAASSDAGATWDAFGAGNDTLHTGANSSQFPVNSTTWDELRARAAR